MLNLKAGDTAVHIANGLHKTSYKIVTIARETKTQLVLESGKKFGKKDGAEAVAYSTWRMRDTLAELTPAVQAKIDSYAEEVRRRNIIRAIEGAKFDKLPTDVLEMIKQAIDTHAK